MGGSDRALLLLGALVATVITLFTMEGSSLDDPMAVPSAIAHGLVANPRPATAAALFLIATALVAGWIGGRWD